jgi:hypothetical protein
MLIAKKIQELKELLVKKNADRVGDSINEFECFEQTAERTGFTVDEVFRIIMTMKEVRLDNLLAHPNVDPSFESIQDNLNDLAGYYILFAAWYDSK